MYSTAARTFQRAPVFTRLVFVHRGYAAAAAAASKSSAPPVPLYGLDGTYASALYSAAAKASAIEGVEKSLGSVKNLLNQDSRLSSILVDPSLSAEDSEKAVQVVGKAAKVDATVGNLLKVLADNHRLNLLPSIIDKYYVLFSAYQGIIDATVTSATKLDSKTINRLESAISKSKFVANGKKLRITNKVDATILGGLVVEVGDRTVDLSVSNKIAKLDHLLTESI